MPREHVQIHTSTVVFRNILRLTASVGEEYGDFKKGNLSVRLYLSTTKVVYPLLLQPSILLSFFKTLFLCHGYEIFHLRGYAC
jgi:hypothetical protein